MEQHRVRWLVGGAFVIAIALFNFATYTVTASQQSTFNILGGNYYYFTKSENSGDSIGASFQETSGNLVSYYIMSSAQYASFQTGTQLSSVYSIENVPSGNVAYTFASQDSYYFVFRHGSGLINSTETVAYQRTYSTHDSFRLELGILFVIFGAIEIGLAFRPRKSATQLPTYPPPTWEQSPSSAVATPAQPPPRICGICGSNVEQSATFCPSCGTKLLTG